MANKKITPEMMDDLYEMISSIESKEQCKAFFEDLCSYKEIEQMAQRVKAAKLLMDGNTYTQIIEQLDISSTTLARVNKCIQYGKGYQAVLTKTNEND